MKVLWSITVGALLLACRPASGQIPTVPKTLHEGVQTANQASLLTELTTAFNDGDWKTVQTKALAAIKAVPVEAFRQKGGEDYVVLLWAGSDASGDPALLWCLVHDPKPDAYTTVLPGLMGTKRKLYEIYLSDDPGASFTSYYMSTQVEDVLPSQIPAVAEAVAGPLFSLLGGVAGVLTPMVRTAAPTVSKTNPVYAWVRQVSLPMARADVKAHFLGSEPVTATEFGDEMVRLETRLRFNDVSNDACARELATAMARAAKEVAVKSCTPVAARATTAQRKAQMEGCLNAFDTRFVQEYKDRVASCGATADMDALKAVNLGFRKLAFNWSPEKMKAEATFTNRPLTHFGFGALSSLAFSGKTKEPRAKVEDGVLVEDPLPRALTAVVINYNIPGFSAESKRVGLRERFNLFGGAAITPEFGLTGGVNFILVRGLGVNIGYTWLFHQTKKENDKFGDPPSDPKDPMRLANVGVWYAGLSYNFK